MAYPPNTGSTRTDFVDDALAADHNTQKAALDDIVAELGGTGVPRRYVRRFGSVDLDDPLFGTGNDDTKLVLAMDYCKAEIAAGRPGPTIRLAARLHTFAVPNRIPYDGLSIAGPYAGMQEAVSGIARRKCEIRLNYSSNVTGIGWFHRPAGVTVFECHFANLNFVAQGVQQPAFLTNGAGGSWWILSCENITSNSLYGVLGTTQQSLALTGCHFTGPGWNLNNGYGTTIHVGGSDSIFFPEGCFLDSVPVRHPATGAGLFHMWCDSLEKSYVGPMFITAEEKWGACLISGSRYNVDVTGNPGGPITFYGTRFEGRNQTQASFGAVYKQNGGIAKHFGTWIAHAMENPTLTPNFVRSPVDAGAAHIYGQAHATFYGTTFDRCTTGPGALEATPMIYASDTGTIVRPHDLTHGTVTGVWTGLPRVRAANGATVLASDGTYTVI